MTAKQLVEKWVDAFNRADVHTLESLYAPDAVNHQSPNQPVSGSKAIGQMFANEFAAAPHMHCIPVQLIAEGDWAVLEWKDPKGFCGCGFFMVQDNLIQVQRGYWDKLSFMKLYNIPV
jgi:hypothetical protein